MALSSMTPPRLGAATVLTLALVAGACASSSDDEATPVTTTPADAFADEGTPVDGGKVVWGLEGETDGLNPISGRFAASGHMMASAVFDPLASIDAEGAAVPYLAEALVPNDDFTVWTIDVREGVTFHDGTALTGQAVADTLVLHQDSAVTSKAVAAIDTVQTTGPLQVTVTMKQPYATFPYLLSSQAGYIPSPAMLDDPNEARTPVGTGPFKFQKWDYGTSFVATKYENYWQGGKPHLDAIEFRAIPDNDQRIADLLDGNIDATNTFRPADIARLAGTEGIQVLNYDRGEERFVQLNAGKAPFDNVTARMAVRAATDSEALRTELFGEGGTEPAFGLWAEGQLGHRENDGSPTFDLEAATALVAEYEAETGGPLAFTLTSADDLDTQQVQQLLKQQWEAAGMQVELQVVAQADLVVAGALGNYQAADWRNFGGVDPDQEYQWLHSSTIDKALISLNFAQYANPEIDEALDKGRSTTDPAVRDEAYATVERVLNENSVYVWLYRVNWAIAANDNVHGFGEAANGTVQTVGAKTWIADLWKS